jgi:hypothetical protein
VPDHASQAIKAAHQMQSALKEAKNLLLKVGIASGPCIGMLIFIVLFTVLTMFTTAGVTGKTKWVSFNVTFN